MDSSAILLLGQATKSSLNGFCETILTVMLAAQPPFAPAHSLSLVLQLLYLVCEFSNVLSIFSLSLIQSELVSIVCKHACLIQGSVERQDSLLREAFLGDRGRQPIPLRTTPGSFIHCTYHSLSAFYLFVYLLLSGSSLGCKLHEAIDHCVIVCAVLQMVVID